MSSDICRSVIQSYPRCSDKKSCEIPTRWRWVKPPTPSWPSWLSSPLVNRGLTRVDRGIQHDTTIDSCSIHPGLKTMFQRLHPTWFLMMISQGQLASGIPDHYIDEVLCCASDGSSCGDGSKPWHLVNPKIAGKWMFIPLKMVSIVSIGIDPYPNVYQMCSHFTGLLHRSNPLVI